MMGLGYTPSEPIRDEDPPEWDPYEIVPCEECNGRKSVLRARGDGTSVVRRCPTCRGKGELLRGNPPGSKYGITFCFVRDCECPECQRVKRKEAK